ncbi:MAG: ferrous iron transport protein B [Flavobacteriales bacterium]|nr:ferrous iron transport protein B [Flavobacteriales bacterium]MCB9204813.1 ferrous iron transport protein B [Flavobacteriales bacterium]
MEERRLKVALVGNPNSGKTSLFNKLTGLHQKVGNFPGITVEKKSGQFEVENLTIDVVDLPGTYSLQPRSMDEEVTADAINDPQNSDHPDLALIVVDASHLKTSLYLALQVLQKQIPAILVMNMADQLTRLSPDLDIDSLETQLDVPIIKTVARDGNGISELKQAIATHALVKPKVTWDTTTEKHAVIKQILGNAKADGPVLAHSASQKLDDYLTHPILGLVIFIGMMGLVFQSIYSWSAYPMEWIEHLFATSSAWFAATLPESFLTRLWVEGIWAGLGGVVIFIPQIAILFFFVTMLEETGYMARVSFMSDRWLRKFGLQGRSIVPLIGGVACAVPAILAARTIPDRKERLLTIMVTPFMSCSARLPVYALLIALVIPAGYQGLTLLGLYLLGVLAALGAAFVLNKTIPDSEESHFLMELPDYRAPKLSNVLLEIMRKVSQFITNAGKIIVFVSILLWLGASFGPGDRFAEIEQKYESITAENKEQLKETELLENSYIGILGKGIEPVIKPLGYDWKIGIALITSFAAREVFVGTMATIYSVGAADEDVMSIRDRMQVQTKPNSTEPLYDLPFGLSLLVFYAFAMQCMSTLAVVKTETGSWKWPIIQFLMMTGLAYICSLAVYQLSGFL